MSGTKLSQKGEALSLRACSLNPDVEYRIDGIGSDQLWRWHGLDGGIVEFHGPRRELARLPIERLYQVRHGHLHYVSD